jgi:hypothetical protein
MYNVAAPIFLNVGRRNMNLHCKIQLWDCTQTCFFWSWFSGKINAEVCISIPSFSDFNSHGSWHNITRSQVFCYRGITFHEPFTFTIDQKSSFSTTTFCDEATSSINTWNRRLLYVTTYCHNGTTYSYTILPFLFMHLFLVYLMALSIAKII